MRIYRIESVHGGGLYCGHHGLATEIRFEHTWQYTADEAIRSEKPVLQVTQDFDVAMLVAINNFKDRDHDFYASRHPRRPGHDRDGINLSHSEIHGKYLHGFSSVPKLKAWMQDVEPSAILDVGGVIQILDVRKCIQGNAQVLYRPEDVQQKISLRHRSLHQLIKNFYG